MPRASRGALAFFRLLADRRTLPDRKSGAIWLRFLWPRARSAPATDTPETRPRDHGALDLHWWNPCRKPPDRFEL